MGLRSSAYVGVLSLFLLGGCSLFGDDDVIKQSPLPKVENQFKAKKNWSTSVGDGVGDHYSLLRPVSVEDMIIAADRYGTVKAMTAENGKQRWRINLADKTGIISTTSAMLSGGLIAADGNVYVGSERAVVYSIKAEDGSLNWKTNVAGEVLSRPTLGEGLILIHTANGILQALKQENGEIEWTANLDAPSLSVRGSSTPALARGAVIVGGDSGRVSAVLLEQGQLIWQQRISQPTGITEIARLNDIDITPVIQDPVIYAIGYNGSLAALDIRTGQIHWQRDVGSVSDFIVEDDRIYLVDQNDKILGLTAKTGVELWSQNELSHRNLTAPVLYQGSLIVGDADGYLHWMGRDSGAFVSQHRVSRSGLLSAPQVINDQLVIQAKNGTVYSFSL